MNWIVQPSERLQGEVTVPGDKSITHRALMHAALARGVSRIDGALRAGVSEAMIRCLGQLGAGIESDGDAALLVRGGQLHTPPAVLDCGHSGTTMRLLLGALAGQAELQATVDGSPGLRRRPMNRVIDPLRQMGAAIDADAPPLLVRGARLRGIDYTLPVASAQVKAALLLAALSAEGPTTLREPGPSRDHSERLLRALGVEVVSRDHTVTLDPPAEPLPPFELAVPGDMSSAAFLIAAAVLLPDSEIAIRSVGVNPTRSGLLDVLAEMGAQIAIDRRRDVCGEPVADLTARASALRGVTIGGDQVVRMIDEFPLLAVLATQAEGATTVRDASELRLKESDRIGVLAAELRRLGAHIEEQPDGFVVEGATRLRGASVDSHGDHRLAMALAVAGLLAEGETVVHNAEVYRESFPTFAALVGELGGRIA